MSLAAILHEVVTLVDRAGLGPEARADVLAVLHANQSDVLRFMLALGLEANVEPSMALRRAATIYLNIASLQIADDIADGDCDYLDNPAGAGTAAQYILQNLFYSHLIEGGLPARELVAVADDLARGAAPQSIDVRTSQWDLARSRAAAEGFGGAHHSAYFRIVLHRSELENRAAALGQALGNAVSVTSDIRSRDRRFTSLKHDEQIELIDWALDNLEPVRGVALTSLENALTSIENTLVAELGRIA